PPFPLPMVCSHASQLRLSISFFFCVCASCAQTVSRCPAIVLLQTPRVGIFWRFEPAGVGQGYWGEVRLLTLKNTRQIATVKTYPKSTLIAARRCAASRLFSPHKRTHELPIHVRRDRLHINSCGRQDLPRVFHSIHARRFNRDLLKSRRGEFGAIFVLIQCARHAADPKQHALANLFIDLPTRKHV